MKIAILQPNYIPWKGVFDLINQVDTFVFLDDAQYTSRDWRNRNLIKTNKGLTWLTVPIKKTSRNTSIKDIEIFDQTWQRKHFSSFEHHYSKAAFFKSEKWILEDIYLKNSWYNLCDLNIYCTKIISDYLGIKTNFFRSSETNIHSTKGDRILDLCKHFGAAHYISGPAAKNYLIESDFKAQNIILSYIQYDYPKYTQLHGDFEHQTSILDLILNCGTQSINYITHVPHS